MTKNDTGKTMSKDFGTGVNQVYPKSLDDFNHVDFVFPADYTAQTDKFTSDIAPAMGRPLSEEQAFQILSRKYEMTREEFEKMKIPNPIKPFTRKAHINQLVDKVKGSDTVKQVLEDKDHSKKIEIEIAELGNGALAETLPNGKILINDNIDKIDDFVASRLIHELSHHVDVEDENYLDRPEEKKAFQKQIQFLVEKGYSTKEIQQMLVPIFDDYKSPEESVAMIELMVEQSKKDLKLASSLHKKTAAVHLTFTADERDIINKIQDISKKLGIKTFLAGGLIRDRLLGVSNADLDFVVSKNSEQLAAQVAKTYGLQTPIKMEKSGATMISMLGYYIDLIDAEKVFSPAKTLEEGKEAEMSIFMDDAYRRDLTINSLMYGLGDEKLYDPTGKGMYDLKHKIIRTIIDPMIKYRISAPDMLRALRFAATRPGFQFAPGMLEAMKANAERVLPREKGGDISGRKIARELRKATSSPDHWAKMKTFLAEVGLYQYIGEIIEDVNSDSKKHTAPKKEAADYSGRQLPDTSALPQESTLNYPYYNGAQPEENDYNAGKILKNKELDREVEEEKKLKKFVKPQTHVEEEENK